MRRFVTGRKATLRRRASTGSQHSRKSTARSDRSSQLSHHRKADRFSLARQVSKTSVSRTPAPSIHGSVGLPSDPPLLRLPSEVRICILRYLIPTVDRDLIFYTDCELYDAKCRRRKGHDNQHPLAILRTNQLIYHEAISILYSENAFHFIGSNYLPILDFVRRLGPDAKSLVRKIRVTWLTGERGPRDSQFDLFCMAILDSLPGLITFDSGTWVWF